MNWKRILSTAALYTASLALSVTILAGLLHLWRTNLHDSFCYRDDGLLMLVWTKTTIESGWYLDNNRMAAPGVVDNRAFPVSETLHFAIIKFIALFDRDPALVLNVYMLLAFPLSALAALFVFRHFGCSPLPAMLGSQLFAFLPYPIIRMWNGHTFLAACFLLPLASMVLLWIYLDEDVFFQRNSDGRATRRFLSGRSFGAIAISLLLASSGIYYAFFYCFFLIVSAFRAAVMRRQLQPVHTSAILIVITSVALLANLSPSLIRIANKQYDPEALHRKPEEAELYGLRIIQLVHPVRDNRFEFLDAMKVRYKAALLWLVNENDTVALGALGAIGFAALLLCLLTPPLATRRSEIFGALSRLNIFAVLLGTIGGLGALVSFSGFPFIRGYNRIGIYIGFFSIFAFVLLLDWLKERWTSTWWRLAFVAALPVLLLFGLTMQTGRTVATLCLRDHEVFRADREFARQIESVTPPHGQIFQLPCVAYPEASLPGGVCGYEMAKPYLHTKTLRWSYGAFENQPAMQWQTAVGDKPVVEMLTQLALADFKGVFIDRRCYPDQARALEAEIGRLTEQAPMQNKLGYLSFFSLCSFQDKLKARYDSQEYDRLRTTALKPCLWKWGDGFDYSEGNPGFTWRWSRPKSYLEITNPSDEPRWVTIRAQVFTDFEERSHLHVGSPLFTEEMDVNKVATPWERTILLPPGKHRLDFECAGPCTHDHRQNLSFRLTNFHIVEMTVPPHQS